MSGIFFGGPPGALLDAWPGAVLEVVITPSIAQEYRRVCRRLADLRPGIEWSEQLERVEKAALLVVDVSATSPVTADPADDKFMWAALIADAVVVSGDRHLLDTSGWRGVRVLTPRTLLDHLQAGSSGIR